MQSLVKCIAAAFAVVLLSFFPALAGTVYDVTSQWSDVNNPNGVWAYRQGTSPLPHVSSFALALGEFSAPQPAWSVCDSCSSRLPAWLKSIGVEAGATNPHDWVPGDVVMHTTDGGNGVGNGIGNLTWTSPGNGVVNLSGAVWNGRNIGRSNDWHLLVNGVQITGGSLVSGDGHTRAAPFNMAAGSGGAAALQGIAVTAGEVIELDLIATSSAGDFVGVNFAVDFTPAVLLVNGSFEAPVIPNGSFQLFGNGNSFSGWTVVGAAGNVAVVSGSFTQSGFSFPAEDGSQWLDLTGTSNSQTGIEETVPTTLGATYNLSYFVGNVVGGIFGTTSTVQVFVDGTLVQTAVNSGGGSTLSWQQFNKSFVAAGLNTTIRFLNADPSGDTSNGLDNIVLSEVSAPAVTSNICSANTPAPISGSTGAQGGLDPANIDPALGLVWPTGATSALIAMDTGLVQFSGGNSGTGFLPGTSGTPAFSDGKLNFTNVHLPAGTTVQFTTGLIGLPPPVLLLSCQDVALEPGSTLTVGASPANVPVPGAFQGGSGSGHAGFGPRAGSLPSAGTLYPPIGGAGGDAGSGVAGGPGGSGGPALVIAAAQKVTLNGSVSAAGANINTTCGFGKGGGGGSVRVEGLVVDGTGTINTSGGTSSCSSNGPDGPIEIQAFLQDLFTGTTSTVPVRGNAPVAPVPANLPKINIDQVSLAAPVFHRTGFPNTGSLTQPDVVLPAPSTLQVPADVNISTQQVPDGTFLKVEAVGTDGSLVSTKAAVSQAAAVAHLTLNAGATYQIVATPSSPFGLTLDPVGNTFTKVWTPGWDIFNQPLDYTNSYVTYTQPAATPNSLSITYHLVGAAPNSTHAVGVHMGFGHPCPATFGQFPSLSGCGSITREGQTATVTAFEMGTLTTGANGNGDVTVQVNGIASGTYEFIFNVRLGLCGGACAVIYESPGPFGLGTVVVTVP